ncbi:MAG: hypothetical protein FGF52_02850 [Candidatus Brockarchaeota archaeon]|nr:hypothetical protein [Candidatus Brockarchaeota archaeon]
MLSREETKKYVREKWIIRSEEDCWVPLYLLVPKNAKGKLPAILCAHGHGSYGKDSVAGVHFNDPNRKAEITRLNYNYADVPDAIAAIAPKPLLIENGASDTCFWIHSALKAHEVVRRAYQVAGKPENLWIEVFAGEHSFSGRMALNSSKNSLKERTNKPSRNTETAPRRACSNL